MKLTVKQIKNACDKHKYLLFRYSIGKRIGINAGISKYIQSKQKLNDNQITNLIGFEPCDFNTYLNFKIPFITP